MPQHKEVDSDVLFNQQSSNQKYLVGIDKEKSIRTWQLLKKMTEMINNLLEKVIINCLIIVAVV